MTGALGLLLVAGVFTDGWAHFNRPGLETFFTPWHAFLYSSLAVMTLWLTIVAWRSSAGRLRAVRASLPIGYGLALVGAAVFAIGGLTDLLWHQAFGIEVAVDALLSPTHLLLGAGGILILSTGMRSQRVFGDETGRWPVPARLSLALTLAVVVFFLLYMTPFAEPGPLESFTPTTEASPGHRAAELPVIAALAGYLLTTVIITVPVILMARGHAFLPRGAAVLVVAPIALLPVAVVDLPAVPLAGAAGAVLGALAFDALGPRVLRRVRPDLLRWALPAALVVLVWSGQLAGLALSDALRWPTSLWTGVVVLSGLLAAAVGFASSPSAVQRANGREGGAPGPSTGRREHRDAQV